MDLTAREQRPNVASDLICKTNPEGAWLLVTRSRTTFNTGRHVSFVYTIASMVDATDACGIRYAVKQPANDVYKLDYFTLFACSKPSLCINCDVVKLSKGSDSFNIYRNLRSRNRVITSIFIITSRQWILLVKLYFSSFISNKQMAPLSQVYYYSLLILLFYIRLSVSAYVCVFADRPFPARKSKRINLHAF